MHRYRKFLDGFEAILGRLREVTSATEPFVYPDPLPLHSIARFIESPMSGPIRYERGVVRRSKGDKNSVRLHAGTLKSPMPVCWRAVFPYPIRREDR